MNKVILFDLDGTLIDSTEAILESFGVAFESFGVNIPSSEEIKSHIGHPLDIMFANLGVEEKEVDSFVVKYKDHYKDISKEKTFLLPNALKAVELASRHARLGVVTTKTGIYSKVLLEHLGLMDFFEVLIGREDVINPKPHPEPIQKAISFFDNIDKNNCFMIGDTCMDIKSAKNAMINGIGITSGYATIGQLKECGDNIFCDVLEAVENIVKKNNISSPS